MFHFSNIQKSKKLYTGGTEENVYIITINHLIVCQLQ